MFPGVPAGSSTMWKKCGRKKKRRKHGSPSEGQTKHEKTLCRENEEICETMQENTKKMTKNVGNHVGRKMKKNVGSMQET